MVHGKHPNIQCQWQAGLGEDREMWRRRRESKQERLSCVWVSSTNAGGFVGAKKEEKGCKAL